jgi:hypothetical protein
MQAHVPPCGFRVELPDEVSLVRATRTVDEKYGVVHIHEEVGGDSTLVYTVGCEEYPEGYRSRHSDVEMLREAAYHLVIAPPGRSLEAQALVNDPRGEAMDIELKPRHGDSGFFRLIARGSHVFYVGAAGPADPARAARSALCSSITE